MTIEHMEFFLLPRRLPLVSLYLLPSGCRLSLRDVSFLWQGSFQKLKSLSQEMQVWLVAVRIRIMWTYHLGKGCLPNSICFKYSYLASQHRPLLQSGVPGDQEQCTSCLSPQCLLQAWSLIVTCTIRGLSKRHLSSCYSLGISPRWRNAGTKEKKATSSSGWWGKHENTHTCTQLSVHAIRYDRYHDRTQARVRDERELWDVILDGTSRGGCSEMVTFELRNTRSDRVNHKISNLCKLRITFLFHVFTCMCICTCPYIYKHKPTKTWMWKSEDNLQEDLSLYGVSPRDWTRVVRLGSKYLYLPNHLVKHLFNE